MVETETDVQEQRQSVHTECCIICCERLVGELQEHPPSLDLPWLGKVIDLVTGSRGKWLCKSEPGMVEATITSRGVPRPPCRKGLHVRSNYSSGCAGLGFPYLACLGQYQPLLRGR